ncbi:extracellular solute-binding protein [Streptomyces griseorubiginosus]
MDMFYNKKLFEKYGLQAPKTYADIESICTTLKKKAPSGRPDLGERRLRLADADFGWAHVHGLGPEVRGLGRPGPQEEDHL